jgi:hypothetical protein
MDNGAGTIRELEAAFHDCGYTFKHFPDGRIPAMRWQAGRIVVEVVELPDGKAEQVEYFHLLAWAETTGALIDQLGRLPASNGNGAGLDWPFF